MGIEQKDIQIQAMASNLIVAHGLDGIGRLMAALVTAANYDVMTASSLASEVERQGVLDTVAELYAAWKRIEKEAGDL